MELPLRDVTAGDAPCACSLVATERQRLVGIVTVANLLELIGRGIDKPIAATTRWNLRHRAPHRKRETAQGAW